MRSNWVKNDKTNTGKKISIRTAKPGYEIIKYLLPAIFCVGNFTSNKFGIAFQKSIR